jgi:hypothetical protein
MPRLLTKNLEISIFNHSSCKVTFQPQCSGVRARVICEDDGDDGDDGVVVNLTVI